MNYYIILLNEHNDKVIKMISHPLDLKKIQKMKETIDSCPLSIFRVFSL